MTQNWTGTKQRNDLKTCPWCRTKAVQQVRLADNTTNMHFRIGCGNSFCAVEPNTPPFAALTDAEWAWQDREGEPCIAVNSEAGTIEATFEDVPYVAEPVLPGVYHWIDKHVALDDGRLVGIAIWATKPPTAPSPSQEALREAAAELRRIAHRYLAQFSGVQRDVYAVADRIDAALAQSAAPVQPEGK